MFTLLYKYLHFDYYLPRQVGSSASFFKRTQTPLEIQNATSEEVREMMRCIGTNKTFKLSGRTYKVTTYREAQEAKHSLTS